MLESYFTKSIDTPLINDPWPHQIIEKHIEEKTMLGDELIKRMEKLLLLQNMAQQHRVVIRILLTYYQMTVHII